MILDDVSEVSVIDVSFCNVKVGNALIFSSCVSSIVDFSPDNVTGCGTINNCFGEGCQVGCKVECHNNCKQECEGEGWRRHGRWDDEEECVNDCDSTCTRNCNRNNRILGGKYSLNTWIFLIPIMCSILQVLEVEWT